MDGMSTISTMFNTLFILKETRVKHNSEGCEELGKVAMDLILHFRVVTDFCDEMIKKVSI